MNVYFISGLGADQRAFSKLKLPSGYKALHLNWINPNEKESLEEYALRLAAVIDTSTPYCMVGLSFGGMLVSELSSRLNSKKNIVISSISHPEQLPGYFKLIAKLGFHKWLPYSFFKKTNAFYYFLFGVKSPEEKMLLDSIFENTPAPFLKWAVNAILHWKTHSTPTALTHIHGSKDYILPIRYTQPDFVINGGGHFLVFTHAEPVSAILAKILCGN